MYMGKLHFLRERVQRVVGSGETGGRKRKKVGCGGVGKKLINWLIKIK